MSNESDRMTHFIGSQQGDDKIRRSYQNSERNESMIRNYISGRTSEKGTSMVFSAKT